MALETQTQQKQIVIKAIDSLGRRVTPADVATKTGLPILVATSELNKVATETGGHLEVSKQGDVAYTFAPAFQTAYLATGIKKSLLSIWNGIFSVGFFLLRISFGIMLIVSFLLVVVLVIAVILYSSRDGDRDGGDNFSGFHFGFFDYLILRDLLWWGTYSSTRTYPYEVTEYRDPYGRDKPKSNFLFDVFSFLFGDGNPNARIEEKKWKLIAQLIRRNNGVVTAEQLAPYTGSHPRNEDGVLPVLVRFDGKPEVTEKGDIVYLFPSLQVSADQKRDEDLPQQLKENEWTFTGPQVGSLVPVYMLAGFNFFGSWWLVSQLPKLSTIIPGIAPLVMAIAIYGTLFLVVPFVRWIVLGVINHGIDERNQARLAYAEGMRDPQPALLEKLADAKKLAISKRTVGKDDIVYTTERDALEQKFEQEFDARP